jgi:cytochrome oxidase Cu insertion factor (SCO1/SenC/PrrC family)
MTSTERTRVVRALAIAILLLATACDMNESRRPIDIAALGPQTGERVPDFSLPDQNGRVVSLDSVLGPNGALLMFYRSADW